MNCLLSVIIPTYNEENRIKGTLLSILKYFSSKDYRIEIIITDDGSEDRTLDVVRNILENSGIQNQIISFPHNLGKGAVVKRGMLAARGEYHLFCDADLSTPIDEVERFMEYLVSGRADIVIGSRGLKESIILEKQTKVREYMGRMFNKLCNRIVFSNISDSQCGFKCFNKKASHFIFSLVKLNGFSFDAEVIFLASKYGFNLVELPVSWRNSSASKVKLLVDPVYMFYDIIRIRWLHRKL